MTTEPDNIGAVRAIAIEDEMRTSYLDYAMSVIVTRALPDVRDGLKPSQRRILFAMNELGLNAGARYRKSSAVVGDVMGKYHPHGDAAVYETTVRMAQSFVMRYPLIDGQGNFGSVDGDSPAAMRYTEARLTSVADEMLTDIDSDTVALMPNYDGTRQQPTVLPARVPNLLLNGASGIAVGMGTSIPPHNLSELCDGLVYLLHHPHATMLELGRIIQGPDFPTAGNIMGREGIVSAYATGRGRVVLRAQQHLETLRGNRAAIIVTELPYQVNKAVLQERIAELVNDHKIDGISDLRDESDRRGMRLVIELKRDAQVKQVLNQLYKHTALQSTFSINMLALVHNQPRVLNLDMALRAFLEHRRDVITRRTQFDLRKAEARQHILDGRRIALDNLDRVISIIRSSSSSSAAAVELQNSCGLSDIQAQNVLDMQLGRLAALERQRVLDELAEVTARIADYQAILASPMRIDAIIEADLVDIKARFGDERRTRIVDEEAGELSDEDLITPQDVVVTMTTRGYIKRVPADTYRPQARGGRGKRGMATVEQDNVEHMFVASTHDTVLFFTNRGRAFQLKVYELPEGSRQSRGVPVANLIALDGEDVETLLPLSRARHDGYLVMATRRGVIKRTSLYEFRAVRRNGLLAIRINQDDELAWVRVSQGDEDIILVTSDGRAARFAQSDVRPTGRTSAGVFGIRLRDEDHVVTMDLARDNADLLVVTEHGYGKRTDLAEYNVKGRRGMGVVTLNVTDKTGTLVAAHVVGPEHEEIILISANGIVIRQKLVTVRRIGRNAQGVRLMRLNDGDKTVTVALSTRTEAVAETDLAAEVEAGVDVVPAAELVVEHEDAS